MTAITDNRIPSDCIENLKNSGFEVITLPASEHLASPVCAHTDMLLFFGFGKIFCHRRYYEKNTELIDNIVHISQNALVISDEETSAEYPHDVLLNCAILGKYLLCNKNTASKLILDEAAAQGYEILHTRQGYTKCSVCVINDNAVITSDRSIYDVCIRAGIDALLTEQGNVVLNGYEYGFIGGASGVCGDTVYFCGDITKHPSGDDIEDFCKKHGKEVFCLYNGALFDCGSIFFV